MKYKVISKWLIPGNVGIDNEDYYMWQVVDPNTAEIMFRFEVTDDFPHSMLWEEEDGDGYHLVDDEGCTHSSDHPYWIAPATELMKKALEYKLENPIWTCDPTFSQKKIVDKGSHKCYCPIENFMYANPVGCKCGGK